MMPQPHRRNPDLAADVHHLTCCDDDMALCGRDVTDFPFTGGAGEIPCPLCLTIEAEAGPCPDANCPNRSAPPRRLTTTAAIVLLALVSLPLWVAAVWLAVTW